MEPMIYFKCTACSECFISEDVFFAHTRTWHCKILISEGQDADTSYSDDVTVSADNNFVAIDNSYVSSDVASDTSCPSWSDRQAGFDSFGTNGSFNENNIKLEPVSQLGSTFDTSMNADGMTPAQSKFIAFSDDCTDRGTDIQPQVQGMQGSKQAISQKQKRVKVAQSVNKAPSRGQKSRTWFTPNPISAELSTGQYTEERRIKERPHFCRFCEKAFSAPSDVSRHERIHTGVKPYVCDVCGKSFNLEGNLNAHKRLHTGEKPYSCSVCGKSFTRDDYLKIHTRVHTGEKPYTCDKCGKRFNRRDSLRSHLRSHSDEKTFCLPKQF